eukprot:scaffold659956_cov66-Prasinocladus_malaysianus.AAC.1
MLRLSHMRPVAGVLQAEPIAQSGHFPWVLLNAGRPQAIYALQATHVQQVGVHCGQAAVPDGHQQGADHDVYAHIHEEPPRGRRPQARLGGPQHVA